MGHYVIGLEVTPWRPVVEKVSGRSDWVFLDSARQYRPRPHDRVLGFFGLTEVQLLQRCAVEVYAFTHRGLALPHAGSAWANPDLLELSCVTAVHCVEPAGAGFEAGAQALLSAAQARRQRSLAPSQSGQLRYRPRQTASRNGSQAGGVTAWPGDRPDTPPAASPAARCERVAAVHFQRVRKLASAAAT